MIKMDLPWGDERTKQFITNIGLITSNGPFGQNIMSCEWTHHVSYSPGFIAICIRPDDATYENIKKTKEFGVNIASTEQAGMISVAGGNSGKNINKVKALEDLGFKFYKANKIKALMVKDAVLNIECKLFKEISLGDHIMFIGEVVNTNLNNDKIPIAYHKGRYGQILHNLPKPSGKELEDINNIINKHRKKSKTS